MGLQFHRSELTLLASQAASRVRVRWRDVNVGSISWGYLGGFKDVEAMVEGLHCDYDYIHCLHPNFVKGPQDFANLYVPLDPKTWKNEGFKPLNMGEITLKNEGNVDSHGSIYIYIIYHPSPTCPPDVNPPRDFT